MTNSKTTKRALFSSVVALLLCFTMLLGTTFAWFTDSVTSANNIIKSGNLDVNLYYWDNSMATGTSVAIEDEPNLKLFRNVSGEEILWEPGATGFGQFEVANEGSLALKYQLTLNFYDATATAEGKTLADVLSVYAVARNANTGDDEVMGDANLETLRTNYIDSYVPGYESQALTDFVLEGYLLPGESFKYELGAFWEPSDKDNDYNVAGGLSINFGVTLLATQMTYEEDVYDDQYDKDATYPQLADMWDGTADDAWYDESATEYVIDNAEEFAGFAALVNNGNTFAGKTVKLNRDIDLRNKEWKPIGNATYQFQGTFDGGNHKISNMTVNINNSTANQYVGLFGYIANASIKNLTVKDSTLTATASGKTVYAGAIVGAHYQDDGLNTTLDNFTVENVTIDATATTTYVGGAFGYCSKANVKVTNGTVSDLTIVSNGASRVGGLIGCAVKVDPLKAEDITITNVDIEFTGSDSKVGGIVGWEKSVSNYTNVSVSGSITEKTTGSSGSEVGGFVGISHEYPKTYTDCTADVEVNTKFVGGGFTGSSCTNGWGGGQYDTYINCATSGNITAPYAGGFIAHSINNNSYVSLKNITVSGNINGSEMAGGIIATTTGSAKSITITNAKITGTITGGTVAGVCANALMASGETLTLTNVESTVTPLVLPANANVVVNTEE